ncbi:hypothetical protein [Amycolatopsis taiwanensis]|uniref:Uncharacterized protein n=1 Tax=Amycolatopsis taiwanensis TaxID=342230 RepID=A0A9W6VGB9_9PSEU|nr:hypothetical protein [Amycolatopsis taiwanensis]GLY67625.1 hypothetical protein Atai01_42440 [Amycolatopsis taiwanensis]
MTEKRARAAVDRVSAHQVGGHGRRVFGEISGLLAHEHARLRVRQVAVPFGICTEPANVKASGQACPYKFTCLWHLVTELNRIPGATSQHDGRHLPA